VAKQAPHGHVLRNSDQDPAQWLWQADLARIALRQVFEGWSNGLGDHLGVAQTAE